ncbi:diguanylate cyclase [Pseudacidovorax sp. RU35E]|uniref:sensor domain-containing diguanylate cyclase n=1 Tax=Pseudacidovorax sp. RU35E TaxID=1907403 RepID=UPI0009549EC4|nr:sensor domain-containing diguanylate cyclase [Pseudacidovorax sp. RU35E]SIR31569.1 diguanylate cyclase (GGDEF) domain-containing protein [Pseudacidovorax sp. RU35E]
MTFARRPWTSFLKLRHLIIALTTSSAVVSLVATVYASYRVQREQLISQSLDYNRAYADKLASSVEDFFHGAQQQLAYSAERLAPRMDDAALLEEEVRRLNLQTDSFNSVVVVDMRARILAAAPESLRAQGTVLQDPGTRRVIEAGRPYISAPYQPPTGNLLIFVAQPILAADGRKLGMVAGTIYLTEKSVLNQLLGTHYYRDGSYLYVVDAQRRILHHPDRRRIGEVMGRNAVVDRTARGQSGSQVLVNSQGVEMVAGFAVVPTTHWGIVAQRPLSATLEPIGALMRQVLAWTLPLSAVALLLVWAFALKIAKPLNAMAAAATNFRAGDSDERLRAVSAWYFEATQIKSAMLAGLGVFTGNLRRLQKDAATDPLTGLGNRRQFDLSLARLAERGTPFSVVMLDIDYFKRINDAFGHDVGDEHLRRLAALLEEGLRPGDAACRIGGEEFALLLPRTDMAEAVVRAEALRLRAADAPMPEGRRITLSLGVAEWPGLAPGGPDEVAAVLKAADQRLYAAKAAGRNRVEAGDH